MKTFRQYLLEQQKRHNFSMFAPNAKYSPFKGGPNPLSNSIYLIKRINPQVGAEEIKGYFGIKKSPITDESEYNGEAISFHHVGEVWNKGSGFGASDPTDKPNPTFLHIRSIRGEYQTRLGSIHKGISVVISRLNHKGVADEEIHHMFVPDPDVDYVDPDEIPDAYTKRLRKDSDVTHGSTTFSSSPEMPGAEIKHDPLSDKFEISKNDAKALLKDHLDFELPHRDTPDSKEYTIPIGAFHGQPDYM